MGWRPQPGRGRLGGVATSILAAILILLADVAGSARAYSPADQRAVERAHALCVTGRFACGLATYDSLLRVAEHRGDEVLLLSVAGTVGSELAWFGRPAEALPHLQRALALTEARADSARFVRVAIWLGKSLLELGRHAEAESLYARAMPMAQALGDVEHEGFMHSGVGSLSLFAGRTQQGLGSYARARELLARSGNEYGEIDALIGQGRAHYQIGDIEQAHDCYHEAVALARRYQRPDNEADALNNLGASEQVRGDPEAGLRAYRAALALRRGLGNPAETIIPATNAARCLAELGRHQEALASLDSLLVLCEERGFSDRTAGVLELRASIRVGLDQVPAALADYRRIVAMGDAISSGALSEGFAGAAIGLVALGRVDSALTVIDTGHRVVGPRLTGDHRVRFEVERVRVLMQAGRTSEAVALALATDAEAARLRMPLERLKLLLAAARGEMAVGHWEEAGEHLEQASLQWEQMRSTPADPEWRERLAAGHALHAEMVGAIMDNPRSPLDEARKVALAFETGQRFKARTLVERIQGAQSARAMSWQPVSLDEVQSEHLHPGELLLDAFVGDDATFLFAVTRSECEVVRLPGEDELAPRVGLLRELLATNLTCRPEPARARAESTAAAALWTDLFSSIAERFEAAEVVFFAPDRSLYLLPLDALLALGADEALDLRGGVPVVSRVPSAALLALARRQGAQRSAVPFARGLVLAGREGPGGEPLPGAGEEALRLTRGFAGMVRATEGDLPVGPDAPGLFREADLLHLVGHTRIDDQYPWRSGILLDPDAHAEEERVLRAEGIAALPLRARLVVLSGCESACGRVLRGEGIQGLSSAFLAAGVPCLVATLWPVDDRCTARLMAAFYEGLGEGLTVGRALAAARAEIAAMPEYRSAAYWGGFVVVGEPNLVLPLAPRPGPGALLGVGVGLSGLLAVLVGWRRRSGSRRRPGSRRRRAAGKGVILPALERPIP